MMSVGLDLSVVEVEVEGAQGLGGCADADEEVVEVDGA